MGTRNSKIHPQAIVESGASIGAGTRVWAFVHVLGGATIASDCNICDGVFVENDVQIGSRVTIKSGVQLWDGVRIHDEVFIGPNVTFTNDPFPRSRHYLDKHPETVVEYGASIGANATILPGIRIGRRAMIGAGAVVTSNVPANSIVIGNPARVVGFECTVDFNSHAQLSKIDDHGSVDVGVGQAKAWKLPVHSDARGSLTVGEIGNGLPFLPRRFFIVYNTARGKERGGHAHKSVEQFLVCANGSTRVFLDDGVNRAVVTLNEPHLGLYIPTGIWATEFDFTTDAVLHVLASGPYDSNEYVTEYEHFLESVQISGDSNK